MKKRLLGLFAALLMVLSFCLTTALAEGDSDNWWEQEYWSLETLLELGAEPPTFNGATNQYEITNAKQLLFMTGEWKPQDTNNDGVKDAPRDGYYLLMQDIDMTDLLKEIGSKISKLSGTKTEGYLPPISANKDESSDKEDGYFLGTFDGGHHAISNHRVQRDGKYVGLFGYLGYKTSKCYIKDLAVLNIHVKGKKDVGTLAGGCYATVTNCIFTGVVDGQEAIGGLSSSVKAGGGDFFATIDNCFIDVQVNGVSEVGGLTAEVAGLVKNCYITGSISGSGLKSVGGVSGLYDAGKGIQDCVVALHGIFSPDGGENVDAIVGSLEGDSGSTISENLAWEGMALQGNPGKDIAAGRMMSYASAKTLRSKAVYTDQLGWDFDAAWTWMGEETDGYPLPRGFEALSLDFASDIAANLTAELPVIVPNCPLIREADAGKDVTFSASLSLPEGAVAGDVTLVYGKGTDGSAFTDSIPMEMGDNGVYTAIFPLKDEGEYGYYIKAGVDGKDISYPVNPANAISYTVSVPVIDGTPYQITVTPGSDSDSLCFNWLTQAGITTAQLRYRVSGQTDWTSVDSTNYLSFLEEGWDDVQSHSVDVSGLTPDTEYEYQIVGLADGKEFAGATYTVRTLPEDGSFTVMVISDMQAEDAAGYEPFVNTYQKFVEEKLGGVDMIVSTGDSVEDGYKVGSWKDMFKKCQNIFASVPTVLLPGNHEYSGDTAYVNYTARTNLPNGYDDPVIGEYTGWFTVGDACFVIISTEVFTDVTDGDQLLADRAAYYEKQKAWAKDIFEQSGCRWRIILTHRGPYTTNHNGLLDVPEMIDLCDELNVDLYLNGHDHSYIRATCRGNEPVEIGQGTTYMTTSPMGVKFDDYIEGIMDDKIATRSGSAAQEQQKFCYLTFSSEGIAVTAYERAEGDVYDDYHAIETFNVTTNLSGVEGRLAAEDTPVDTVASTGAEEPAHQSNVVLWIILGVVAVAAIGTIVLICCKKKCAAKETK